MHFRRPRIYIDAHLKIVFSSLLMLCFLALIITGSIRSISRSHIRNNLFFVQLVNYTMPVIKVTSYNEEFMEEGKFSLRDIVLQSLGININDPIQVIGREVSFFKTVQTETMKENGPKLKFSFNPFNLEDSMIFRQNLKDPEGNDGTSGGGSEEDDSSIPNKVVNIYDPNLKKNTISSKPEVLIYHSHTTESFKPYGSDNEDPAKNICAVGDELADELKNNYGISVIHDKTVNSKPDYTKSYTHSKETLDKYLKQYGDFKLIIDMHRDAGGTKTSVTTKMNGKNAAKIMFVMSRGNPRFKNNQVVVNKLLDISNKLFPGFNRGIYYYNNKFNHFNADRSDNAVLIEVGSEINTLDEAEESAKYMARIIGEYINGKR